MKHRQALPVLLLALVAGSASAHGTPPNRLVGAWKVDVAIGPCSLPNPVAFFSAYNSYHAGGTLTDFNWVSPTTRSVGQGQWRYVGKGRYQTRFEFFRYDNPPPAAATGFQDIKVLVTLDPDRKGYTGKVSAQQRDLAGNPVGPPLCGKAVGTRMGF